MNKSLEALEELKDEIIPDCALEYEDDEGYKDWVIELYQTIKQDLEAYEQLKQDYDKTLINNGELVVKVADLQKENNELNEKSVKAVGFVKLLIDNISNKKLNDDRCSITNINTGEEYGNLKEYITKMFKIIWNIDIKWLH